MMKKGSGTKIMCILSKLLSNYTIELKANSPTLVKKIYEPLGFKTMGNDSLNMIGLTNEINKNSKCNDLPKVKVFIKEGNKFLSTKEDLYNLLN